MSSCLNIYLGISNYNLKKDSYKFDKIYEQKYIDQKNNLKKLGEVMISVSSIYDEVYNSDVEINKDRVNEMGNEIRDLSNEYWIYINPENKHANQIKMFTEISIDQIQSEITTLTSKEFFKNQSVQNNVIRSELYYIDNKQSSGKGFRDTGALPKLEEIYKNYEKEEITSIERNSENFFK